MKYDVIVLGAGTGGLTAALSLLKQGKSVCIIEKNESPGGWMRQVTYENFSVDFGYKHIYSRIPIVDSFWKDLMKDELKYYHPRTGILFQGKIFEKDSSCRGILRGVPVHLLIKGIAGYFWEHIPKRKKTETVEDYYRLKRGKFFAEIFSQRFDEKLKGRKWSSIKLTDSPGLKNNDLKKTGIFNLFRDAATSPVEKEQWYHPRLGTGSIINELERQVKERGGVICYNSTVIRINKAAREIHSIWVDDKSSESEKSGSFFISSLSAELTGSLLGEKIPQTGVSSGRSVILVYFFLDYETKFPHNCLQVSSEKMIISRITNYAAFGGDMVPEGKGCICAEIFCHKNDEIFNIPPDEIGIIAKKECVASGIFKDKNCMYQLVIKCPGADPGACWEDYVLEPEKLRLYNTFKKYENFYFINRTGSDKSTHAALLSAESILKGDKEFFFENTRPDVFAPWNHNDTETNH